MDYMLRKPELLCAPERLLEQWQDRELGWSILSVFCRYDTRNAPVFRVGYGRVARYAWGKDYHRQLRRALGTFVKNLQTELGWAFPHRVFTDAVPLLERAIAARAGLGFIGKNTLLIRPGTGSFGFLGEVLLPIRIEGEERVANRPGTCGTCTRCQSACPTGAFKAEYQLDARRCISYLTIEKSGLFNAWEREALGSWIFGCDICQEVCPFNHAPLKIGAAPELPKLGSEFGVGPLLELSSVIAMRDDGEYLRRFQGTPLMRAGRENLIRNACCVAVNTGAYSVLPALRGGVRLESDPVARATMVWALSRLSEREGDRATARAIIEGFRQDPDERVREEVRVLLD
jgi:epoxyqueuosine reductase